MVISSAPLGIFFYFLDKSIKISPRPPEKTYLLRRLSLKRYFVWHIAPIQKELLKPLGCPKMPFHPNHASATRPFCVYNSNEQRKKTGPQRLSRGLARNVILSSGVLFGQLCATCFQQCHPESWEGTVGSYFYDVNRSVAVLFCKLIYV